MAPKRQKTTHGGKETTTAATTTADDDVSKACLRERQNGAAGAMSDVDMLLFYASNHARGRVRAGVESR